MNWTVYNELRDTKFYLQKIKFIVSLHSQLTDSIYGDDCITIGMFPPFPHAVRNEIVLDFRTNGAC